MLQTGAIWLKSKLNKKVYLTKIDIKNTFGSIFHQKLIEVIIRWSSDIVVIRKFAWKSALTMKVWMWPKKEFQILLAKLSILLKIYWQETKIQFYFDDQRNTTRKPNITRFKQCLLWFNVPWLYATVCWWEFQSFSNIRMILRLEPLPFIVLITLSLMEAGIEHNCFFIWHVYFQYWVLIFFFF